MGKQQTRLPPVRSGYPDLQEWIEFFGSYAAIPPAAWAEWDRLYEAQRERRKQHAI